MPTTNVFDPTNYTALIPPGNPTWHSGSSSVTFSFPAGVPSYYTNLSGDIVVDGNIVPAGTNVHLSITQQEFVRLAVERFNEVANINLTEVAAGGDVIFATLPFQNASDFGFAYFPAPSSVALTAGDIWLNSSNSLVASPSLFDEGWGTILHELGHAVGLDHPFDNTTLPAALDNSLYTVMSYDPVPAQVGIADPIQQFPATPMLYDIQALQIMYGANMTTRSGDTTYFGPDSDIEIIDGGDLIVTVWDAGGIDTFSAANQSNAATIDLRPGHFSTIGSIADNIGIALDVPGTRALAAVIENAIGGSAGDTLTGNWVDNELRGNGGNDTISGNAGNDLIFGDDGDDELHGGPGDDRLFGWTGNDVLLGDDGNDELFGQGGDDVLFGWVGNDGLYGDDGNDNLFGQGGDDQLFGWIGNDQLFGDDGNDYLFGQAGDDLLFGWVGDDTIYGDAGNDRLFGQEGIDILFGGGNFDVLSGGRGNDTLIGGAGGDQFWFQSTDLAVGEVDTTDFDSFDSFVFSGSLAGSVTYSATSGGASINVALSGGMFQVNVNGATVGELQSQTEFWLL